MLRTLLDREGGVPLPLPPSLAARYGGPLRFPETGVHVFANFVSTIDGIVSFDIPGQDQAKQVSRGYPGDRFMLGLLRAAADAVIVGAGTLRTPSAPSPTRAPTSPLCAPRSARPPARSRSS